MKKIIRLICFTTLLLSGCAVEELDNPQNIVGDFPTFYASFGDAADETTKTYVDEKVSLRWTKDDRLSIFVGNTFNHEYKYDGETGANNGSFSAITSPEFIAAEPLEANYAVYPYNASNEMDTDGSMSVILPSVQKYAQNSFGLGANTMVAATENKEDNFLQFKNLCGYVVVKLYGEGTVTSVKLEGNDGEKISGKADVQAAFGTLPSVTMSEEATTSITLDCGGGVTLGTTAETATEFWLCVPPVTFSKGFTVTATNSDGWQMVKNTSSSKEVVRNTKNALTPIEAVFDTPSAEVVPPDDEIWYITKDNELIRDFNEYERIKGFKPFDKRIVSHTYVDGIGRIKFDGPVEIINEESLGLMNIGGRFLSEVFLPNSIKHIGRLAFSEQELESFHIPDALETVDYQAFGRAKIKKFIGINSFLEGEGILLNGILYALSYDEDKEELIIPENVQKINTAIMNTGFKDFCVRPNTKRVIISEGLRTINDNAFQCCPCLETVSLPSSLENVGTYIFKYCPELKEFVGGSKFISEDGKCFLDALFMDGQMHFCIQHAAVSGISSDYIIPEGIVSIRPHAFEGAKNLSSITLPKSLLFLESGAFKGCENFEFIYGEYASIDNKAAIVHNRIFCNDNAMLAFAGKGIKKYTTSKEVTWLGDELFAYQTDIEEIVINDQVKTLGNNCFAYSPNLKAITLPANLEEVSLDPFIGSDNLETVYFRGPVPPKFIQGGIQQFQYPQLTIYVPEQSLKLYLSDNEWAPLHKYMKGYKYSDLNYYTSTDYSADGTVHTVQTATTGNGVNVVLMGDAFSDRQIADGTYNNVMQKAANALFSEEPYKSYKDYFNVYTVDAVSMTEGYEHGGTVFGTGHGDGTYVYGNDPKVFEYAQKALTAEQMDDALIIVMMNEDAYAGTCFMYYPNSGDCGRGLSIAYFPTSSDIDTFNGLVSHEAGGHGFAKLADEYAYEDMGTISDQAISDTKQMEPYGWWKNVDFTSDSTQVKWSKFLSDERYANEGLGCFEGGLTYWSGVWRPTDYSIMRYNTGGFNAPSREAIWYRIHKLAYGEDWQYNYEDFVAYDAINRTPAAQAASRAKVARAAAARRGKPFQPLHKPVVVKCSWKDAVNNPGKDGR